MGQLIAEIEVGLMIRIWNAMDRPEPTKWPRTMPERAHRWAASFSSVTPRQPPNASKSAQNVPFRLRHGCLEAVTFATRHKLHIGMLGTSTSQPPRLAPHPKAPHPMTLLGPVRAYVWHHGFKFFYCGPLLHRATQL